MTHTCQGLCSNGSVKYPLLRTLNTALSKKEKGEEPEPEEEVGQQYPLKETHQFVVTYVDLRILVKMVI